MNVSFFTTNAYQGYPQLQRDVRDVKEQVGQVDSVDEKIEKSLFGSLPPVRRLMSLPDKFANGDIAAGVGLASLALVNLPEDCRDIKAGYNQLAAKLAGKTYVAPYVYQNLQHPFSFFRGTLLHNLVDPNKAKNKDLALKLFQMDTTVADTVFGQKILNFLGVKQNGTAPTQIKNIGHTDANPFYLEAKKYVGGGIFGDLTARAMNRTTKIGAIILAAIELPKIFRAMGEGDSLSEQVGSTVKQTGKSAINVTSILAGIGYGGALGAKKFGAIGSLVGMGVGAVIGATASNKIQEVIS